MRPPDAAGPPSLWHLPTLLCLLFAIHSCGAQLFQFTQPVYNASIPENARGKYFAEAAGGQARVGVPKPGPGTVRFNIVKGDPDGWFAAVPAPVADFVFLRLRTQPSLSVALNRELQDQFLLLVKATYEEPGRANLETRAEIRLAISDQNDLVPLFHPSDYTVKVPESLPLFAEVVRVRAADADSGLAGQVSYALAQPSDSFAVHPHTGAILLTRRLHAATKDAYDLVVEARDRLVRLFPDSFLAQRPAMTASVRVDVIPSNNAAPTIALADPAKPLAVPSRPVNSSAVAVIRVADEDGDEVRDLRLDVRTPDCDGFFQLSPTDEKDEFLIEVCAPFVSLVQRASLLKET